MSAVPADVVAGTLKRAQDAYERSRTGRIRAIELAREAGWNWAEVGAAMGLSDNGARRLYERATREGASRP